MYRYTCTETLTVTDKETEMGIVTEAETTTDTVTGTETLTVYTDTEI